LYGRYSCGITGGTAYIYTPLNKVFWPGLDRLTPYQYQHPFDRQALITMKKTPGFPALMRNISELGVETYYRIMFTLSCLGTPYK
jgi:hypothetical protein